MKNSLTRRRYSPNSSRFFNMFCTQNLGEARFNDLRRDLLLLSLLKSNNKGIHLLKKHQFYSASHFCFFFNLHFLNFCLIWTFFTALFLSFFLKWNLHLFKFSTWNKKSGPNIMSSNFKLTHIGNHPLKI